VLIVRSDGCNIMQCTCGASFCFVCQQPFVTDNHVCGCEYKERDMDLSRPFTCDKCTFINERTGHFCEACESFRYGNEEELLPRSQASESFSYQDDGDDDEQDHYREHDYSNMEYID
jgi:hypothetical protein